ncbi:15084_t:CDS:2 [Gigaspora margarita]|uniref:15084_t:CDS:1 n=1 Tax=Gigaspora margarita TaxID=4874 RepID=A0ABN7U9Z4_GIGMA|nr:15084_t:CDS:2 [Gigaspora margarita]
MVISYSAGIYSDNEEQYESTIQQQINEIHKYRQIIQSIPFYCQENSIVRENETILDEKGECSKFVNRNNNFEVKDRDEKDIIYYTEILEF